MAGLTSLEIDGTTFVETSGYVNDILSSLTVEKSRSITSNLNKNEC